MEITKTISFPFELSRIVFLVVPIFHTLFCVFNHNVMKTNSSNTGNASADMKPDVQHSGIRATVGNRRKSIDIIRFRAQPDEEQKQRIRSKRDRFNGWCYYCHETSHRIGSCKTKENDGATKLIRYAINTGIQRTRAEYDYFEELIVAGTEHGLWTDLWHVSTAFKHHDVGNLNVFKRIRNSCGVETRIGEDEFLVGVVEIQTGSETMRIQSVFYIPELNRNMLSMDQLILQGYTVKINDDKWQIYPMFTTPVFSTKNKRTGLTKDDEINERRKKMRLEQDVPIMNYVCKKNRGIANGIDKDSQNLKNGQVSVPSSSHVRAEDGYDEGRSIHADGEPFKSTIRGKDEVSSVNFATRADDEEDVRSKEDESGMKDKQKRNAGYKIMSTNDRRAVVENDMGYEYDVGELMRTLYAMYLNMLVYYYKFKAVQGKVIDKEMVEQDKGSSDLCHERRKRDGDIQDEETIHHYAYFAGNDWKGMKTMKAKRPGVSSYMLLNIIKFRGVC
ncbi:putative transcription factor interactor and regulator CCHC(Zn) family [Helianthus annuus]|uniref:Transcription factor interactor and regulator CCHC(Zn) family n=1 Tax=Helianthus annuus TaxID=4232 RepID=A0A9K3GVV0_HELAN|nr:putative transcription factor interactor and regulator CCHC(Zn) family [Helianthus annuus]KAJ0429682.1 putative transcription factor interactor and regulator CCHC(Zn) family [Helianthus annuus]KAJ0434308.1 putative transcription factor interactor and regulator CCHC(Zn) family [Helianthus annuus]KAJ0448123.1 putative transcription factor interactor and regulator CCHC(Zn) family [Helianthus annuus]KAJ0633007.1 putative transcription factor interactor and regulator CCHC(Zn) family [Helianthus a